RKNIGGNLFSSNLIDIINFDQLSSTRTISKSDLTPSISGFGISKSWSSGKTLSETNIFLTDANADGLIDYVKNKKVYFNRIDPNSGLPTFTTNSLETPNVIYKEGEVDNSVLNELPDLSLGNDLMDVVKVWVAPKNGTINISGTISKNFIGIENGIRYSIEKSTNTIYKNNINYPIDDFGFIVNENIFQAINIADIQNFKLINYGYIKQPTLMLTNSQSTNF